MLPFTAITGEYIIDQTWGEAAYTYTSVEFSDPTVGPDWKNLMYMAHSIWDPVTAFQEALGVTTWGSGNTYTNTLWFIATRASTASVSGRVCVGFPVTGASIYQGLIYSVSTGNYVTVGAGTNAYATATLSGATVFNFNNVRKYQCSLNTLQALLNIIILEGTTIQDVATSQYASSDAGVAPMIVNRQTPSSW